MGDYGAHVYGRLVGFAAKSSPRDHKDVLLGPRPTPSVINLVCHAGRRTLLGKFSSRTLNFLK